MNIPILSDQMIANVEAILKTNPSQEEEDNKSGISTNIHITEKPKATSYYIELTFHNQVKKGLKYSDPTTKLPSDYFTFSPIRINGLRIQQDFESNYLTHYEVNVMLQVDQYLLLFYNYKDLRCNVTLYATDVNTNKIYGINEEGEPLLYIENAYCIFKDKVDILKKNPKSSIIPEKGKENPNQHEQFLDNISFQIIPEEDYLFRIQECNAIFTKSTVKEAIWGMCKVAECVDAIMMIEPDNQTVYDNLVIPPILSFNEALQFLQEHYGIYSKGLGFFFQRKTLYVYPKYETSPILPKDKAESNQWNQGDTKVASRTVASTSSVRGEITLNTLGDGGMVHIYMVGDNNYVGMQYYHGFENNTIHIVSNSTATFQDLADVGLENTGYGYIVHHTNRDIDVERTVLEADNPVNARYGFWPINIHETPNNAYLVQDQQNTEIGITSTKANLVYEDSMSNPFKIQSRLYSYRRSLASFTWNAAIPFTFRPGYRICYHYDGEDETNRDLTDRTSDSIQYMTKSGVAISVDYKFTLTKSGDTDAYFCQGDVIASLEVDKTKHIEGI